MSLSIFIIIDVEWRMIHVGIPLKGYSMNQKILVVEDDRKTSYLIQVGLQKDGYRVAAAYDGQEALNLARKTRPDLIILDLMLPQVDGLDICRLLRAESRVAIIMLTGRSTEDDKLLGLDLGADDYVTKPFSFKELLARVRAVLRRVADAEEGDLRDVTVGDLTISFTRHEVSRGGELVTLTPTEFKLLELFARHPGRTFTRSELVDHVKGMDFEGAERTIDTHVMKLRRKIEPEVSRPQQLLTVFGVGYKFEA
jgi:DNA-binding response OmpR family regulator